jgi:O-antigen/teichoic acid export membrane protein
MAVLATLVPFVSLGAPVILVRHLAGTDDRSASSSFRAAVYLLVLIESGGIVTLAALADLLAGGLLRHWLAPGLVAVVALGASGTALLELRVSEYQASFRFLHQAAGLIAAALFRILGMAGGILAASGADHRAAVAGYVTGAALSALLLAHRELLFALRHVRRALRSLRDDLMRIGLPITVSSALGVLSGNLDILIAAAWLAPDDLAQYAVANRLSLVHVTAIGGLTTVALPVAATLARRGSLASYARATTAVGLLIGIAAVLASIVGSPLAVPLVFGDAYRPSVAIFVMLSVGFVLNYPGNPLSQVLYMTGHARTMALVQFAQIAAFAAIAGVAASAWGAVGLAAARTVTNLAAVCVIGVAAILVARRTEAVEPAPVQE